MTMKTTTRARNKRKVTELTTDLKGTRQTMFSSPISCGLRLPAVPPRLVPLLKSLLSHFIKRDFLSAYEETNSPAYQKHFNHISQLITILFISSV